MMAFSIVSLLIPAAAVVGIVLVILWISHR